MVRDIRAEMSRRHEEYVAKLFGVRRSKGSGNQQTSQMDGRQDAHRTEGAMAWDCKATRAASISVTRAMWDKAVKQSHFERPMIPLRLYADDRLSDSARDGTLDLVVMSLHDVVELMERPRVPSGGPVSASLLDGGLRAALDFHLGCPGASTGILKVLCQYLAENDAAITAEGVRRFRRPQ